MNDYCDTAASNGVSLQSKTAFKKLNLKQNHSGLFFSAVAVI